MSKFRRSVKQWLREWNVYFGRITSVQQLDEFFERVRPVTTNHSLIRIGEMMDGGYLVPNDLEGILGCFSPGVSVEVHFEEALARRGIKSFMADYSVTALPVENPMFDFEKKYLGMDNDSVFMTLESWVKRKVGDKSGDLILQMDIEGAEFDVIFDTSNDLLRRFRIIVIEFHRLDMLLDRYGYKLIDTAFRKVLKNFDLVHIHPNNRARVTTFKKYTFPSEMEFTFLRKDRVREAAFTTAFPHELDAKNLPNSDELVLPACWYSQSPQQ